MIKLVLVLLASACAADSGAPDAGIIVPQDPCPELESTTEPALDVGEVKLDKYLVTPGVWYSCGGYTWSSHARRRNGVLGSYGRPSEVSTRCRWQDALDARTPALGVCP